MDVYKAVRNLQKDSELEEVVLKPANSFYRRMQHEKAMEAGFKSFSVGEGQDRAVRLARNEDE